MLLNYRFIDIIRKETKIPVESADAPVSADGQESRSKWEEISQSIPETKKRGKEILQVINDDDYGIFKDKHIKNHPDINFRAIALLKNGQRQLSIKEMQAHFGDRVNVQTTISPFYTRSLRYFKPIIEEFTSEDATLPLPPEILNQIKTDSDNKFTNKKMTNNPKINFQLAIQIRQNLTTWKVTADKLKLEVKDLIEFYLDSLREFKLIPVSKKRTRQNKRSISPTEPEIRR